MTKKALTVILSLILLIPVGVYFTVWNYYAINIPKWDDHAFKAFIIEYAHAADWKAKFLAVLRQHNEHRVALTRLLAWLDFRIFGALNYRHLMIAGNLLLVAVVPLWWELLKKNKKPLFALIPVPFLWLTLAFWENMYWGMSAVQNFGVVTLVLWTLCLCVLRGALPFVISIVLSGITVVTSGNGLLVLPLGALLLFLLGNNKRLAVWLLVSIAQIVAYFLNYKGAENNPEARATVFQLIKGYMAFLGSFAESIPVLNQYKICVFFGSVLFLVAITIVSTTLFKILKTKTSNRFERVTDLFCLGALLFILGTALIVVYSRAGYGFETFITSRYKIYSVLLLLVAYLYVVIPIRGSFLSPYITAIIFLAVTFNVFSYHYHLVDAYNLRKMLITEQFNWTFKDKSLEYPADTSFAANIVAKTPVIYDQWIPLIKLAERQTYAGTTRGLTELSASTAFKVRDVDFLVSNESFSSQRLQDSGVYILLTSPKRHYIFPAYRTRNKSRKELFLKQYYFSKGFFSDIPFKAPLEAGTYKVALIRQDGGRAGILYNGQTVNIQKVLDSDKVNVNW